MQTLFDGGDDYCLAFPRAPNDALSLVPLNAHDALELVRRWVKREPQGTRLRHLALELLGLLGERGTTDDDLTEHLLRRLECERLVLFRVVKPALPSGGSGSLPPPASAELNIAPAREAASDHWIEVRIVDQDGRPAVGVRYRLVLSDGTTREGRTGEHGIIYVDEMPAGKCRLSLPDTDGSAWKTK